MNAKERFYSGVARETIHRLTSNKDYWTSFLRTMGRNYEFTYPEQVMIYAQRPDAKLCKEYDEWNSDDYRRYVRRGSKGIALFVTDRNKPYLRYVFDVSDTGTRRSSPALNIWSITDEYRPLIQSAMGRTFEVGLCQKSMFVVPNHLTLQWANEFLRLYPSNKTDCRTHKQRKDSSSEFS